MKKSLYLLLLLLTLLLVSGCSTVGFKENALTSNTSTIYTYVEIPQGINENESDPCYKIEINNKSLKECMKIDEFMEFKNLKSQSITISATRDDIDKKTLKLDLVAGKTYFLKAQSYSQIIGQFEFIQIDRKEALKSITTMKMANPPETEDDGIFDFFMSNEDNKTAIKEETPKSITTSSKMDEISKANDMKEKGIISDEEFNKLKAEILNAK